MLLDLYFHHSQVGNSGYLYWLDAFTAPPRARKIVKRIARQAVAESQRKADPSLNVVTPSSDDWVSELERRLDAAQIEFNALYADLLLKQIEEQRNAQIRLQLELLGIYQQIEEEDEQAIMLMMMEL